MIGAGAEYFSVSWGWSWLGKDKTFIKVQGSSQGFLGAYSRIKTDWKYIGHLAVALRSETGQVNFVSNWRVPDRFFGIQRDLPYLRAGMLEFKPKWERGSGLKIADFSFER